jgi:hypothetical protein
MAAICHVKDEKYEVELYSKMMGSLHLYKLVPGGRSPEQNEL